MYKFDYFKDNSTNIYQIRIDSEVFTVEVDDLQQEKILCDILNYLQNREADLQQLVDELTKKYPHKLLMETLDSLWSYIPQLKIDSLQCNKRTEKKEIAIFSNGSVGDKLCINSIFSKDTVSLYRYENINSEMLEIIFSKIDFAFVDATHWSPFHIKLINKEAIKKNKPWLLIDGRLSNNPTIGPLFYGRETGCYDCLIDRYKNNLSDKSAFSSYFNYLYSNRIVSIVETDAIKNEYLVNLLTDFAVFEYVNFMNGWNKPETYRTVIEIDYSNYEIIKHKLLRVPYCTTCNSELKYNSSPWLDSISLK